jgi:aminoglycoside phosphotransferase (APT) family kinase protein
VKLPAHPGLITTDWLVAALRQKGVLTESTATEIRVRPFAGDRGFTGMIARLLVRWDHIASGDEVPQTLVAKFPMAERDEPSTYSVRRRNDDAFQVHFERSVRELRFYQEIAPVAGVSAPEIVLGMVDESARNVAMLMEDLSGGRPGDVLLGTDVDDVTAIVDAMASLHAWGETSPIPEWLPAAPTAHEETVERYAVYVEPFLARWGSMLPAPVVAIVRQLSGKLAWVLAELDTAPATVIHGDLHLDNVMFQPGSHHRDAVILDWQRVRRGPAAIDLASSVIGSLAPGLRRAHLEEIYAGYVDRLSELGVKQTTEQLIADTRLVLLRRLAGVVNWAVQAESASISYRERQLVEAEFSNDRLASALLDYDVVDLL